MIYRDPLSRLEYPTVLMRCHKCSLEWWVPYEYFGEDPFGDPERVLLHEEYYYCKACGGEGFEAS